ncbi:hypothetical protein M513_11889 [Trichuris suis]|uniref:Uncharacterized protein n=1 Tax=Trichuris suis TaxID=68888 RepID=A0A085LQJ4_9BILA|nr:hypothetical protein M513_11889 [Trichuris suis]
MAFIFELLPMKDAFKLLTDAVKKDKDIIVVSSLCSSDWWSSMLLKEVMALNKGGANVSTNDTPESSYEIGITMLRQEPLEKKVPNRSPRWAIDWSVLLSFHFVRPLKYLQLEYNQGEMISNSQPYRTYFIGKQSPILKSERSPPLSIALAPYLFSTCEFCGSVCREVLTTRSAVE